MQTANPIRQRKAMVRKLDRRIACEGKITLPAVPGMAEDYAERCERVFAACGRHLNASERQQLLNILEAQLKDAFSQSQRSNITISYQAGIAGLLNYNIAPQHFSLEQAYENWVATRQPPYFGVEPDARVLALAGAMDNPRQSRVLDIGAGTGRNALALARLGHPVDAVELTPKFAELLGQTAQQESLPVRVVCKDVFAASSDLAQDYQLMLLSEVVSDFRTTTQLRSLFELAAHCLAEGGQLVINCFVTREHYSADDAVREFAQQVYTGIFTPGELAHATHGLPLQLESDDSVLDYEKANLPAKAWPPTPWYAEWVSGLDAFDMQREDCPVDMRWLVYRKTPTNT